MKIIKQGNADWPHTVQNICRECGTIYVLELGDDFERRGRDTSMVMDHVVSTCPTCKAMVRTNNPNVPHVVMRDMGGVSLGGKIA